MTKIIIDDSWEFETFRIIEKSYDNPEDLTPSEKKRLRELGLEVKEEE
jgi:hypothetical protein